VDRGTNACGGCGALFDSPGNPCNDCGVFQCAPGGTSLVCSAGGTNPCGGCGGEEDGIPGQPCASGCAGDVWTCQNRQLQCGDAHPCGGCDADLPLPGTGCEEECGYYVCGAAPGTVECVSLALNSCGGCLPSDLVEGDTCEVCGETGDIVCSGDVPRCDVDVLRNRCGGCGTLANQPGTTCGVCGFYGCNEDRESVRCVDPCN